MDFIVIRWFTIPHSLKMNYTCGEDPQILYSACRCVDLIYKLGTSENLRAQWHWFFFFYCSRNECSLSSHHTSDLASYITYIDIFRKSFFGPTFDWCTSEEWQMRLRGVGSHFPFVVGHCAVGIGAQMQHLHLLCVRGRECDRCVLTQRFLQAREICRVCQTTELLLSKVPPLFAKSDIE